MSKQAKTRKQMRKSILTGIKSSDTPHLGNILGAIQPAIEMSKTAKQQCLYFIADMHSLTSLQHAAQRIENTYAVAATWLALGLDVDKHLLYRQSRVPQVSELSWYLSCFMPYARLTLAHSFKDKADNLKEVNAGLFTYPILMSADILLYDAELVPVGKDQLQHIEFTRDVARRINHIYGEELFVVPRGVTQEAVKIVPGIDGRKMSKSYGNFIDIFLPEKALKKRINAIVTSSLPVEAAKDPSTCNVFKLYSLLASEAQIASLREKYLAGGYGFGAVKKDLLGLILDQYGPTRAAYNHYMNDVAEIESILHDSELKAHTLANKKLAQVRAVLGFK